MKKETSNVDSVEWRRRGIVVPLSLKRQPELNYHFEEGISWLKVSNGGKNTTALSYAAFEFRLSIERVVLQYWSALAPGGAEEITFQSIKSYKSIEKQIFQIAGHQKEINATFEFFRLVNEALKIPWKMPTPDIGRFSSCWHSCSELCHIAWSLASGNQEAVSKAYGTLLKIQYFLKEHVEAGGAWAIVKDLSFGDLQNDFIAGRASDDDVLNYLKKVGVYAVEERQGKARQFIGEAIPPTSNDSSA